MTLVRRTTERNFFMARQDLLRVRMIMEANKRLREGTTGSVIKDTGVAESQTKPYEVIPDEDGNPAVIKVNF